MPKVDEAFDRVDNAVLDADTVAYIDRMAARTITPKSNPAFDAVQARREANEAAELLSTDTVAPLSQVLDALNDLKVVANRPIAITVDAAPKRAKVRRAKITKRDKDGRVEESEIRDVDEGEPES